MHQITKMHQNNQRQPKREGNSYEALKRRKNAGKYCLLSRKCVIVFVGITIATMVLVSSSIRKLSTNDNDAKIITEGKKKLS